MLWQPWRCDIRMMNASAQNEDGVCLFSPTPYTRYKSVTTVTSRERAVAILT